MGWFDQTEFKLKYLNPVKSNANVSKKSKLENRRYLIIAIIGAVVVISVVAVVRFSYEELFNPPPPGVGKVGSEHVHAKIGTILNGTYVDYNPVLYPKYAHANDYIYVDELNRNKLHIVATGATLGMFLESVGMKFTSECFIIPKITFDSIGLRFTQTEFCNDGDMGLKFYVRCNLCDIGILTEDPENYVVKDGDRLLIVYDDWETTERLFK